MMLRDIEVGFSKKLSFEKVRTVGKGLCCEISEAATRGRY